MRFDGARTGEDRFVFFGDEVEAGEQAVNRRADEFAPAFADEIQLPAQGMGRGQRWGHEHVDQGFAARF